MQGPERSPINLAFFNADETGIGQTSRRISLIEANGKRSVCVGGLPVYVYEADDNAAEVVCIAMLSCANVANDVAIARTFGCHRNTVGVKGQQELLVGGQGFSIPADSSSPSGRTGLLHFRRLMMAFICYLTALTRS